MCCFLLNSRIFPQFSNEILQGGERIAKSPLLGQIDYSGIDQSYKNCIISCFLWKMSKFHKGKLLYNLYRAFPPCYDFLGLGIEYISLLPIKA